MVENKYLLNWGDFIRRIKALFEQERSEKDISDIFSEKNVNFEGKVVDIKLYEEYCPGIALNMEPEFISLSKGRVLRTDYLFLNIEDEPQKWNECKIGDTISFKAKIAKAEGPFPEIQLSEDDEDPEVLLMIGLDACGLIEIIS